MYILSSAVSLGHKYRGANGR